MSCSDDVALGVRHYGAGAAGSAPVRLEVRERVFATLDSYCETDAGDVRKLSEERGGWRWRVGDYRILFDRDDERHFLTVHHVRHRREAYRG